MTADGDAKKRRAAQAAPELVADETIIGVGTRPTGNLFTHGPARLPPRVTNAYPETTVPALRAGPVFEFDSAATCATAE